MGCAACCCWGDEYVVGVLAVVFVCSEEFLPNTGFEGVDIFVVLSITYDLVHFSVPAGVDVEFLEEYLFHSAAEGVTCVWSSLLKFGSRSLAFVWTALILLFLPSSLL